MGIAAAETIHALSATGPAGLKFDTTIATPATTQPPAAHFICCRSIPRAARKRAMTDATARPSITMKTQKLSFTQVARGRSASIANGFGHCEVGSTSGPNANTKVTKPITAALAHSAGRHRGDAGPPVGNRNTTKRRLNSVKFQTHVVIQAKTSTNGSEPGATTIARWAYCSMKKPAYAAAAPHARSQPTGLLG